MKRCTAQGEELDALRAIYEGDFQQAEGAETSFSIHICTGGNTPSLELSVSE